MKIYNVKVLRDISNDYQGLDDVEVYSFTDEKEAEMVLNHECISSMNMFLEDGCPEEELNVEKTDTTFSVHDDNNYMHGQIVECEIPVEIFAITVVQADNYEPASVSTYFRYSKEKADEEYRLHKEEFFANILSHECEEDATEEEKQKVLDEFICEHVNNDYEFTNGNRYFHCVYGEGSEFIINIEKAGE